MILAFKNYLLILHIRGIGGWDEGSIGKEYINIDKVMTDCCYTKDTNTTLQGNYLSIKKYIIHKKILSNTK